MVVTMLALAVGGARARAQPSTRAAASVAASAPKSSDGVVNLNDASEDELERLPGIGPGKARAIAEHRHAHPFRRIDELTKVKGIGRKTFGRLRPYITTVGPTTLDHDVKQHR
jgi:competence protein ComEA